MLADSFPKFQLAWLQQIALTAVASLGLT